MFFERKAGASPSTLAPLGSQGKVLGAGTTVKIRYARLQILKVWSIRLWQDAEMYHTGMLFKWKIQELLISSIYGIL